jgi:hypothetical protein
MCRTMVESRLDKKSIKGVLARGPILRTSKMSPAVGKRHVSGTWADEIPRPGSYGNCRAMGYVRDVEPGLIAHLALGNGRPAVRAR